MPDGRHPALAVLAERDVRFFVASRFCSATSFTLVRATVAWQVWQLTGSEFQLGLIGLVQFVPVLLLALPGGGLADAFDRRRIVLGAQTATLAIGAVLWNASRGGDAPLGVIYAMVAALAAVRAVETPSRAALLPTLVPREWFPHAVTLHSTFQNLAWVTGPVVAGFAIEAGGVAASYGLGVALVAGSLGCLVFVRPRGAVGDRGALRGRALGEGLAFVRRRPALLGSMTLDMFAVIFASVTALLPVYAEEILGVGARGYGLLASALEAGALLMAVVLLAAPRIERPGRALLVAVAGFGLATIAFGVSRSFPLSLAALVAAGMSDQVSMVARATIVQLSTPDALRGRVSSVNQVFISASNQLGTVESGFLAALTGAPFAVVFGGVACLGVLALVALRAPELRSYRIDEGAG